MWTPKRIVLLAAGFLLFFAVYLVYSHFFGGIDGLPELADEFLPLDTGEPPPMPPRPAPRAEEMLRMAFGEDCPEIKEHRDKLEIRSKGMVLAFADFQIIEGRVRLAPLSIAIFGKTIPGKFPEINTVRAKVAFLTFDKPVATVTDMNNRKILAGELQDNIEIRHNRRTPQTSDDIFIDIVHGPVYYRENQQRAWIDKEDAPSSSSETRPHLWTADYVKLQDFQSRPRPMEIQAKGMDLYLARNQAETAPNQTPGHKAKGEGISGMEEVNLRSSVRMHLFVDANSSFLSSKDTHFTNDSTAPKEKPIVIEPKNANDPPEKAEVVITTQGPFRYEVAKDFAQFDTPPETKGQKSSIPENVVVTRYSKVPKTLDDPSPLKDEIVCDHLELQFRRKKQAETQVPRDDHAPDLEIESAHATGGQVVLTSDGEGLEAHGDDFHYNAATKQTILKGAPSKPDSDPQSETVQTHGMWAIDKQLNKIGVRELYLVDQKGAQQASGKGEGEIFLFDKATGKYPLHAKWTGSFTSTKEGPYELITLVGGAEFRDEEHGQYLKADSLQVWLLPAHQPSIQPGQQAQQGQPGNIQQSRRLHRLEAIGKVIAKSPELNVHGSDRNQPVERLVVNFTDAPAGKAPAQASGSSPSRGLLLPPGTENTSKPVSPQPSPASGKNSVITLPGGPRDNSSATGPNEPAKPPRPIDLSARAIETDVVRDGPKNELDQLRAEGTVRVKQEPASPEDKGVDIRGDTLQLNHFPEGNVLTVTGENLAQLRMDKLFILGTEINVDQVKNETRVDKIGAMVIDSDTDFEGNKLGKTVPLTIHWSKHMFFSGQYAEFHGGIQAEQQNARLACQTLRVNLDRPISLKEGNKGEPAKVQDLICDESVKVRDVTVLDKKIVKDQRIECGVLDVDKKAGTVIARLPGFVRIWQPGLKDPLSTPVATPGAKPAPAPTNVEMKITYVKFSGWMRADNIKHTATFLDDVKVLHMPANNPDVKIDIEKILNAMPANAFYLQSDRLDVISIEEKGKTTKEMTAKGRVTVDGENYSGRAAVVTYNEAKEQIIFQGGANGMARLYKYKGPGVKPDEIVAKKIIYSRLTGEHSTDGTEKFESRP
ncbi:MAG: hypothetical protein ACJ8FY_26125 [Gemmataceae bacterium]